MMKLRLPRSLKNFKLKASVSVGLIIAILDTISLTENEKAEVLNLSGLSADLLTDIDSRVSIFIFVRLWKEIMDRSDDPVVALHLGESFRDGQFGLVEYTAQNSSTARKALERVCQYMKIINELIELRIEDVKLDQTSEPAFPETHVIFRFAWDPFNLEPQATDMVFAAVTAALRRRTHPPIRPLRVNLKHIHQVHREDYEAAFLAPVIFGAGESRLIFKTMDLQEEIRGSDPQLGQILDRYATQQLDNVHLPFDLPQSVTKVLRRQLTHGRDLTLPTLALEMKMTPRNLQRQLAESSTSFSTLLDEFRKEAAPALLGKSDLNVEQVGFRLGYADSASFIRSFKRWYGVTPGAYRNQIV